MKSLKLLEELKDIDVAVGYITAIKNMTVTPFTREYRGVSVIDALKQVAEAQPELKLKDLMDRL